jgi:hypothetical protein
MLSSINATYFMQQAIGIYNCNLWGNTICAAVNNIKKKSGQE